MFEGTHQGASFFEQLINSEFYSLGNTVRIRGTAQGRYNLIHGFKSLPQFVLAILSVSVSLFQPQNVQFLPFFFMEFQNEKFESSISKFFQLLKYVPISACCSFISRYNILSTNHKAETSLFQKFVITTGLKDPRKNKLAFFLDDVSSGTCNEVWMEMSISTEEYQNEVRKLSKSPMSSKGSYKKKQYDD